MSKRKNETWAENYARLSAEAKKKARARWKRWYYRNREKHIADVMAWQKKYEQ